MKLNIAQMYPDYLNMYGDNGNITCLTKRALWRDIDITVTKYNIGDKIDFENTDIIYIGGGTDSAVTASASALIEYKKELTDYVENNGVILAVSNGYELLGNYFYADNKKQDGLGLVDMYAEEGKERFISDIIIENEMFSMPVVGFENHSGRVSIGKNTPLGKVLFGNGNNGSGGTEGVIYKNVIGTYMHGPILPKNPQLCDDIIKRALERKYDDVTLAPLDDSAEINANKYICDRFLTKN